MFAAPRQAMAARARRSGGIQRQYVTDLDAALRTHFPELSGFLPGQREALEAVLQGRDVVAVLPTGGGKTLVYQLAGALMHGTTIVATPLIALMQDQVRRLSVPDDEH